MLKIPFIHQRLHPKPEFDMVGSAVASVVIVTRPFSPRNTARLLADLTDYPVVLLATDRTLQDAISLGERIPGSFRVVLLSELQEDYYGAAGNLQGTDISFRASVAYIPVGKREGDVDSILLEHFAQELSICANCGVKRFVFQGDGMVSEISCAGSLDALVNRHCGKSCLIATERPDVVSAHGFGVHLIIPRGELQTESLGRNNYIVAATGTEFTQRLHGGIPIVTTTAGLARQESASTYFADHLELIQRLTDKNCVGFDESPTGLLFAVELAIVMGIQEITCAHSLIDEDRQLSKRIRALTEQANVQLIAEL